MAVINWPEGDESAEGPAQDVQTDLTGLGRDVTGNPTGWRVEISDKAPTVDQSQVKPFESEAAMVEAMEAANPDGTSKMYTDASYRALVEARIAASMGFKRSGLNNRVPDFTEGGDTAQQQRQERNPLLIDTGTNTGGVKPFEDMDEIVAAMSDPRYETDAKFRAAVDARVAVS